MKKIMLSGLIFCVFLFGCFLSGLSLTKAVSSTNPTGKLIVSVFDDFETTPIKNATICVIETNEYYYTDSLGRTKPITLYAKPPTKLSKRKYADGSPEEYTILCYKNGYTPHILYGVKIINNQTRVGVIISLENLTEDSPPYTESYDFPTEDFSLEILNKYKK